MAHQSEIEHTIGANQELLAPETLKSTIKDRISKLVGILSASEQQRKGGFEVTHSFDQIPGIESGSMGFFYSGSSPEGEMIEFWRFYGIPDENDYEKFKKGSERDACQRISLEWIEEKTKMKNGEKGNKIRYFEWDENKENEGRKGPYENSREALEHVDPLIRQFEIVTNHTNTTKTS